MILQHKRAPARFKLCAFSLIEISIVLFIIGIVGSQLIPLVKNAVHTAKLERTKQHQHIVLKSITDFMHRNHRMPFAALPSTYGIEDPHRAIGIVPYQTLGLNEHHARDGFGHYMTYALNSALGNTTILQSHDDDPLSLCFTKGITAKPLSILNYSAPSGDFIAVVLVSHYQGKGAYTIHNVRSPFNASLSENNQCRKLNVSDTGQFCQNPCGDQLFWVSRNNLLSSYMQVQCVKTTHTHPYTATEEIDDVILTDPSAA